MKPAQVASRMALAAALALAALCSSCSQFERFGQSIGRGFGFAGQQPITPTEPSPLTRGQIDKSIHKACEYLYSVQHQGNWEAVPAPQVQAKPDDPRGTQWGMLTAMATAALLTCGESPHDPRIGQAVEFLSQINVVGVPALAWRCQVWSLLPATPQIQAAMKRDCESLLAAMRTEGSSGGLFNWVGDGPAGPCAAMPSLCATLALGNASRMKMVLPPAFYASVDRAWRRGQGPDGGWGEDPSAAPEVGMASAEVTASALAVLSMAQSTLRTNDGLDCRAPANDGQIDGALAWLSENYASAVKSRSMAAMYAASCVGQQGGYKSFGAINWYRGGCEMLVRKQEPDGSWGGDSSEKRVADAAMGLVFLARGNGTVAISKLRYDLGSDTPSNWNQRCADAANFTRWLSRQSGRELSWQVVDLADNSVEEMLEAPILYIAGSQPLVLSEGQRLKLREYVERGGMVLANADCASPQFTASIIALGRELFPQYEFRELFEDHNIFTEQPYARRMWKSPPSVLALGNGARELMVLIPTADPARDWQTRTAADGEPSHELAGNIYFYATDRRAASQLSADDLRFAREDPNVRIKTQAKVARLEYPGNWNPEPGGWVRLAAYLRNRHRTELSVQTVRLGAGQLDGRFHVAHLTGTDAFRLDDKARRELRKFVDGGGTLVIDAAGGSQEFAQSAESEISVILPSAKRPLPILKANDDVFQTADDVREASYRPAARAVLREQRTPRLRGLSAAGRVLVYYSPEDLSVGLLGTTVDGIYGYEARSATSIMANIVLSAADKGSFLVFRR